MTAPTRTPNDFCHPPENLDIRVWRYMAVERFESLLDEGIFFARSHLFEDQREGSATHRQAWSKLWPPLMVQSKSTGERKLIGEFFADHGRWDRQWVCVSCWHMNDAESDAMWKLYAPAGKAVCVQSTFRRLDESLRSVMTEPVAPWPMVGVVRYIDHATDLIPSEAILAKYFHKPREYAHEREVRAVLWDLPVDEESVPRRIRNEAVPENDGWPLPVADLNHLIERVYVAPQSSPDLETRVRAAMEANKVTAPLLRSSLETPPVY